MAIPAAGHPAGHPSLPGAGQLPLAADEVHCWSARLDVPPEISARLDATLSADERDRSTRFKRERDRRHFMAARGILRDILGRYLGTEPGRIGFRYNAFGKPDLAPCCDRRLKFNLSHADGLALIAIATHSRVGVDLESVRPQSEYAEIARHSFSAREVGQLSAIPKDRYAEAFLGCWTKQEAYLKAHGYGLTIPMGRISVPLTTDPAHDPIDLCLVSNGFGPIGRWSFYTLRPAPGYIGALALEGAGRRLCQCQWEAARA